jgi:hypothetical protein
MSIFVRSPKIRLATVKRGKLHNRPGSKDEGHEHIPGFVLA